MSITNFSSISIQLTDVCTKPTGILILAFAFILTASGQELNTVLPQDSSKKRPQLFNLELSLTQMELLPAQSIGITQQSFSDFVHQSLTVPMPPFSWTFKSKIDLESAWKQELAKQDEYKTLRTILGSVEMGGVAYLTYLHLKKYGLK
jgi:hypothetical protein